MKQNYCSKHKTLAINGSKIMANTTTLSSSMLHQKEVTTDIWQKSSKLFIPNFQMEGFLCTTQVLCFDRYHFLFRPTQKK